jgi:hypothetical protein
MSDDELYVVRPNESLKRFGPEPKSPVLRAQWRELRADEEARRQQQDEIRAEAERRQAEIERERRVEEERAKMYDTPLTT